MLDLYSFIFLLRTALILAERNPNGCGISMRDILCLPREVFGPAFNVPLGLPSLDNLRMAVRTCLMPRKDVKTMTCRCIEAVQVLN